MEFSRGILKTKGHYIPLIMSKGYNKGCLISIFLNNMICQNPDFMSNLENILDLTNL